LKQLQIILCLLFITGFCNAQVDSNVNKRQLQTLSTDSLSLAPIDSIRQAFIVDSLRLDSTKKAQIRFIKLHLPDTTTYQKYFSHPYLPFSKSEFFQFSIERTPLNKDAIFYILVLLVTLLAIIRLAFPKYFKNLFLLILQTSVRQKQTREQLLQNNLASVLLNILFFVSGGIYIALFIQHKAWVALPFYQLILYSSSILFIIYIGKYLFLLFSGWVFHASEATSSYTFIVFLVNKVLGIVLVPFLLVLTYSPAPFVQVAFTISIGAAIVLFVYRYLISFGIIRLNLKVSALHFFLYLCAVEVLPLLLIYKLLLKYIAGSF